MNGDAVPTFENKKDEIEYWKNLAKDSKLQAKKWKEKYEATLKLYADAVSRKSDWISLKRKSSPIAVLDGQLPNKKIKLLSMDPFGQNSPLPQKIQHKIANYLTTYDFLTMTEVSKDWKQFVDKNNKIKNLSLNVDLSIKPEYRTKIGKELLQGTRKYDGIKGLYDVSTKENMFMILAKHSGTLKEITVNEKLPRTGFLKATSFNSLHTLTIESFLTDDVCMWLANCQFPNLKVVNIKRMNYNDALFCFLYELDELQELYISGNKMLFNGWDSIAAEDPHFEEPKFRLTKLGITLLDQFDEFPLPFILLHQSTLKSLTLNNLKHPYTIMLILGNFPNLEELSISFLEDVDEEEMEPLYDAFDALHLQKQLNIKKLTISNMQYDYIPELFVAKMLEACPNVEELRIEDIAIDVQLIGFLFHRVLKLKKIYCKSMSNLARINWEALKRHNYSNEVNKTFEIIELKPHFISTKI